MMTMKRFSICILLVSLALLAGCPNTVIEDAIQRDITTKQDATLTNLVPSQGTLSPAFSPDVTSYSLSIPESSAGSSVASLTMTPSTSQTDQTVSIRINGGTWAEVVSGIASSDLAPVLGDSTVEIRATAGDDVTSKTYAVSVHVLSLNALLSGLSISSGTLTPVFSSTQATYTAVVSNATTSVTVTPTAAQSTSTLTVAINGGSPQVVGSGTASPALALVVGDNTIVITVTAENGSTNSYTVTIHRKDFTADPVFAPVAGVYTIPFDTPKSISISTATSGASIRYTTDGTEPTSSSGTVYSGAISLYSPTTIKAIAFASNYENSAVTPAIYTVNPRLFFSDGVASDALGLSMCLSDDGSVLVVGAPAVNSGAGAVYIFTRSGYAWSLTDTLTGSSSSHFGQSVACSVDGTYIAVGAPNINSNKGMVAVFYRSTNSWNVGNSLAYSSLAAGDYFGCSVAMSDNGKIVVIGAYGTTESTYSAAGCVYVYKTDTTPQKLAWSKTLTATAPSPAASDYFGFSVACSSDGSTVISGSYYKTITKTHQGVVYVFNESNWGTPSTLTATDATADDYFGYSVSCSDDGGVVAVGAQQKSSTNTGAAYVYTGSGSTWTQSKILTASDAAANDQFGQSIAISGDGTKVIVGAMDKTIDSKTGQGQAYTYSVSDWSELKLSTLVSDGASGDNFGYSVTCSSDGTTLVVGAPYKDISYTNQGSAYAFFF